VRWHLFSLPRLMEVDRPLPRDSTAIFTIQHQLFDLESIAPQKT
jgi:hypothetical protein